jgi:hypothetical protein
LASLSPPIIVFAYREIWFARYLLATITYQGSEGARYGFVENSFNCDDISARSARRLRKRFSTAAAEERCARVSNSVSKELDYLVVGSIGSENWLHATFGTKIRKAVEYRDGGCGLAIVDELHWRERLA